MNKHLKIVSFSVLIGLFFGFSTPAVALVIVPDGHTIYLSDFGNQSGTTLFSLEENSIDPVVTEMGSESELSNIQESDFDSSSNTSYLLGTDNADLCAIGKVDIQTGSLDLILQLFEDGHTFDRCSSFTIDPLGNAWVTFMNSGDSSESLGRIDLSTGEIFDRVLITGEITVAPGIFSSWLAHDPTTGLMYLGTENGDLFSINPDNGETLFVGNVLPSMGSTYSADFDSWGRLWFTVEPVSGTTELWSASPDDLFTSSESMGTLSQGNTPNSYRAIFLLPPEEITAEDSDAGEVELAETGRDTSELQRISLFLILSGMLLLVMNNNLRRSS